MLFRSSVNILLKNRCSALSGQRFLHILPEDFLSQNQEKCSLGSPLFSLREFTVLLNVGTVIFDLHFHVAEINWLENAVKPSGNWLSAR